MDRKKELKQQYKQMKPNMGLLLIRCKKNNKCYLHAAKDLKSAANGAKIRLDSGMHPYRELQKEWNAFGESSFLFEILERLPYDKDEAKTDYSEDLLLLKMIWEDKLMKEGAAIYQKRAEKGK